MDHKDKNNHDVIDEDLYEEFEDEELYELVQEEKRKAIVRASQEKEPKPKRPFPKWAFWLIALAMVFNVVALLPQTFSIPAIDFLITSAKLSSQDDTKAYKKAVVVVETEDSKGTGFAISSDGKIMTNHHVIEGEDTVTVAFPDDGLLSAEVTEVYPSIDLAILETNEEDMPHLTLADQTTFEKDEAIDFIGNPLRFNGIANEGKIIGYTQLSSWEQEVLMIEAPVYRGNSGSPIINKDGEVIGVIFATLDHGEHGRVGLFVPIDYYYDQQ
ncbi:serine protease [Virgibacillus profundi]|uniref:Serine protease n=1 Tax=Virgibacillus profundi TaxID=2024555 RepID=A0A2A2IEM8_9BACI|nr:serine protease [Virgibacillus profundi]PAV29818.1 serine protease [Virgibacillus profundi]PXY53989.1 serine protease [Virgibacillus profundi]